MIRRLKLFIWNNVVEKYFGDWLEDYAHEYEFENGQCDQDISYLEDRD